MEQKQVETRKSQGNTPTLQYSSTPGSLCRERHLTLTTPRRHGFLSRSKGPELERPGLSAI
jgi:hypothetical protein